MEQFALWWAFGLFATWFALGATYDEGATEKEKRDWAVIVFYSVVIWPMVLFVLMGVECFGTKKGS